MVGLRWGLALAIFEIALAWPVRWPLLQDWPLQLLFFLAPLAIYSAAGWFLGWLFGHVAGRLTWLQNREALPIAAIVIWIAVADAGMVFNRLDRTWAYALAGAVLALSVAWLPWFRKPRPSMACWRLSLAIWLLAPLLTAYWLLGDRNPVMAATVSQPASEDRPSLVLVTWDTVRADVLPIYGGTGLETPNLQALAAESVVFEDMVAVAPITGPSHASLLTGRMPPSHGLRSNGNTQIAPEVPSIAQSLRANGYDTAAFVSAYPVKGKFGFSRGFRIYDDRFDKERLDQLTLVGRREMAWVRFIRGRFLKRAAKTLPGDALLDRVDHFLQEVSGPFFLWVHFFDAHGPHDPEREDLQKARQAAAGAVPVAADPENCGSNFMRYRAEIMELDRYLGRLRASLESRDPGLQNTALFLTSDHGHCFGEGGYRNTHLPSLLEATQRIPGVFRLPKGAHGGQRLHPSVGQVDLAATFAELAGAEAPEGHQGLSLMPLITGGSLPSRAWFGDGFYLEAFQNRLKTEAEDQRRIGLRDGEWKYYRAPQTGGEATLYRWREGENENLAQQFPEQLRLMEQALQRLLQRMPEVSTGERRLTEDDQEALQELGYAEEDDQRDS